MNADERRWLTGFEQKSEEGVVCCDAVEKGTEYLKTMRRLALESDMIALSEDIVERIRICSWIGKNIEPVNAELGEYLQACHSCFYPEQRKKIQIFAAPLAQKLGVDAFCNLKVEPVAILIDAGRLHRPDWLSVVAHEYAHAHLGTAGHQGQFLATIQHLCLGLGLEPPYTEGMEAKQQEIWLQNWPHCPPVADPLAFWRGGANA
ncbi:hypothetical protein NG798_13695 [Ancylothrix sp. C2]|uniref:hypothetical protein n=1 Tax=Ancylothrix sp. D3o TaxID=2953691 RepID=UPI0021BAD4C7|nr:hypothetical protein [Ancylothrix sp. D3o]MCT7950848.1 hypothetical protein [Ancylothrix sp. D3o]